MIQQEICHASMAQLKIAWDQFLRGQITKRLQYDQLDRMEYQRLLSIGIYFLSIMVNELLKVGSTG
jgi:hypothetical protein